MEHRRCRRCGRRKCSSKHDGVWCASACDCCADAAREGLIRLHYIGIVVDDIERHGQYYVYHIALRPVSTVMLDPAQGVSVQPWGDGGAVDLELTEPLGEGFPARRFPVLSTVWFSSISRTDHAWINLANSVDHCRSLVTVPCHRTDEIRLALVHRIVQQAGTEP